MSELGKAEQLKLQELSPVELPISDLPEDVVISRGALGSVSELAHKHLGNKWFYLADPDTLNACKEAPWLGKGICLPPNPVADTETVKGIMSELPEGHNLVAIGSGTINDLAKHASTLLKKPYIAVGTAASMNGYASGIAAILDRGLKTTVNARPPKAIILDTDVLAKAPLSLTQAGLGDLISKPVSDTDWWLASQIGQATYSDLPSRIVGHAIDCATASSANLRSGQPSAHGDLSKALVLSGVAMVVAGSSSPASGGEHLISHLWDMENLVLDRVKYLHGAQVGLTTCLSAGLYSLILEVEEPQWGKVLSLSEEKRRLLRDHPRLRSVIQEQALAKHETAIGRVAYLKRHWREIRAGLRARQIPGPTYFRNLLKAIDAPLAFSDFSLTRQDVRRSIAVAKDIRNRFTILDLATDMGILPEGAEAVLVRAGF